MSSAGTGFTEDQESTEQQVPFGGQYIPTEEERRVLQECNRESLLYRSLPFSVVSMAVTQALVARGALSASPRFGSIPKVAFAGFCGYLAGKLSYMKTCQEKFDRLENSHLRDLFRQKMGSPPQYSNAAQSKPSDRNAQPAETPSSSLTRDYGHGYSPDPPTQMSRPDDFSFPAQPYDEDEEPKKKPIFYEGLRVKNRENYEVTLIQKADTMDKESPQMKPERPKMEEKKNKYGDAWEE